MEINLNMLSLLIKDCIGGNVQGCLVYYKWDSLSVLHRNAILGVDVLAILAHM